MIITPLIICANDETSQNHCNKVYEKDLRNEGGKNIPVEIRVLRAASHFV